jgi:hypothetical protein
MLRYTDAMGLSIVTTLYRWGRSSASSIAASPQWLGR